MVLSWLDPNLLSGFGDNLGDELVLALRGGFVFVPEEDAHHVPIQGHGRKIPHQVLEEIGYFDSRKRFPLSYPIKVREDQFLGYACGREGDTGL